MNSKNSIYASALRGYCDIDTCWTYLAEISQQLISSGSRSSKVDLNAIRVEGKHFILEETEQIDESANVWLLAAGALELITGSPIFNGKGQKSQTKETPLPRLAQEGADTLNQILVQCLNFNKSERPTMKEIADISRKHFETAKKKQRMHRVVTTYSEVVDITEIDKLWPEKISKIRNLIIYLTILLASSLTSFAQSFLSNHNEPEMQKLLTSVLLLRNKTTRNVDEAQDILSKQITTITLMDELRDAKNDCTITGKNRFSVNLIVNELKRGNRVQASDKELLSGTDSRFAYSLYEKGIKKGATATYTLTGRSGQQCFVIVPYSTSQAYTSELQIGTRLSVSPQKDKSGITYYVISAKDGPKPGESITLKISNKNTQTAASFVVINHNYRN
jgi:hypothetical protein